MKNFSDIFTSGEARAGLAEILSKVRPFNNQDGPTLSSLYNQYVDGDEVKYMLTRSNVANGELEELIKKKQIILKESIYPTSEQFFNGKILAGLRFSALIEEIFGKDKSFKSHLEVAAGTSLSSYAMRRLGTISESDANDIVFRGEDCKDPNEPFNITLNAIKNKVKIESSEVNELSSIIRGTDAPQSFGTTCLSSRLYDLIEENNFRKDCKPYDEYFKGDFLSIEYPKKYNLITMYAGINYFDNKQFFEKVKSISEKGCVLICINDCFYECAGGGMNLPIHLPWIHTLFRKEDLINVYRKYFSEEAAKYLELAYYYPDSHINPATQMQNAAKAGFKQIYFKRIYHNEVIAMATHTHRIQPLYKYFKDYRPNNMVSPLDFGTYYSVQVFQKDD